MNFKEQYFYRIVCVIVVGLLVMATMIPDQRKSGKRKPEKESTEGKKQAEQQTEQQTERQEGQRTVENPIIRVLLRGNDFAEEVHQNVGVSAPGGLYVEHGEIREEIVPGEIFEAAAEHPFFEEGTIRIWPKVDGEKLTIRTLRRSYGELSYSGILELFFAEDGIAVVNELPLEQYLCGVVPSEMPSSYEMEALKCQAVCARSYAYNQMKRYAYPQYQAHVDDSTSFQVYGNAETADSVVQAVKETAGQKLWYKGQVAAAYYFSTSSGKTTDMSAWGDAVTEANAYLQSICVADGNCDYEKELPWYRWEAVISRELLSDLISTNAKKDIGLLQHLEVTKRGAGGIALAVTAQGENGCVTAETENKIRSMLGGPGYQITKNDGTIRDSMPLLPSAFFNIEEQKEKYIIRGGGLGHGIGMSQNGANEMAKQGMGCEEILKTFYKGVSISCQNPYD